MCQWVGCRQATGGLEPGTDQTILHVQGSANLQGLPPPASPPCSPENALCTGQHCHAARHTYACPKNSSECLGGRGCPPQCSGQAPAAPRSERHLTRDPLPGAGGNSVTSQEARAVTAPCGKGEGAQRSPQPRSLYAPPPPQNLQSPPRQRRPYLPRRRLHDAEGTSILRPPPTAAFKGLGG